MSVTTPARPTTAKEVHVGDLQLLIDGSWCEPSNGQRIELTNPSNGLRIGSIPDAGSDDVDRAVRAADAAFADGAGEWPSLPMVERRAILQRVVDRLAARDQEIACVESADGGMAIRNALAFHAQGAPQFVEATMALAPSEDLEGLPLQMAPAMSANYLRREPVGVVAAMPPSNAGYMMSLVKTFAALVCGNTVVLKPSPFCSATAAIIAEEIAAEPGIPSGAFHLVFGDVEAGSALTAHPLVRMISFTGSVPTARAIQAAAANNLTNVTLELGGKGPVILCEDADIDLAVDGILWGIMWVSGQACVAGSRLLVHSSMHDEFVARLSARLATIKVGDPADFDTDFGPVASPGGAERIKNFVDKAVAQGVRIAAQGHVPPECENGYFYPPTILTGITNTMDIAREEIFGPVLSVLTYETVDEAVTIANDSDFGLAGSVWSTDSTAAVGIAKRLRVGTVWVNDHHLLNPTIPFGGYKHSGVGREFGSHGIEAFTELKHIHIDLTGGVPNPAWAIVLGHKEETR